MTSRDRILHFLESLPVAARRQRVAALAVVVVMLRVPVPLLHSFDQRRRDAVALDRQRVVGVALIYFVDEAQILFPVLRKSGRFREVLDNRAPHRFPHRLHAPDNGRRGGGQNAE